jgi:hypothetical protein
MSGFQAPQQFLYFFPLPQGHGSLRPTLGADRFTWILSGLASFRSPDRIAAAGLIRDVMDE